MDANELISSNWLGGGGALFGSRGWGEGPGCFGDTDLIQVHLEINPDETSS